MIKFVKALSRQRFENRTPEAGDVCISISGTMDELPVKRFKDYELGIMSIFDDCTPKFSYGIPMSMEQAKHVYEFIKRIHALDTEHSVYVHCAAGICRSGAVASFIAEFTDMNISKFLANNPMIQPNLWVENLLFYVWSEDK